MFGLGEPSACNYRPGRYLTYAIDFTIGGVSPVVFHVSSLFYHLLAALTVYFVYRRWAIAGAALLLMSVWTLHPVNADAVAYISGRRDVVSTLFFLLAFLQFVPQAGKKLNLRRLLLGVGLFYLAIRSKEMAVTLPAVVVWAAVTSNAGQLGQIKSHLKRRWPLYAALLAGAVIFIFYRVVLHSHSHMEEKWWGGSPANNFATVFTLYLRYLFLVVWPIELIGDYFPYTIPIATSFGEPLVLLGLAVYLGMIAIVVVSLKRGWKATAFGLGWFLITMLPVSHIFPHHEIFAEHYLYLPMIGLFAALLPLVQRLLSSTPVIRRVGVVIAVIVVSALAGRTYMRAADYSTELRFYETAHELAPHNSRIIYNLGLTYMEADQCERAIPLLVQASRQIRRRQPMSRGSLVAFMNCSERLGEEDIVNTLTRELLRRYPLDPLGLAWRGRRHLEAERYEQAVEDLGRSVLVSHGRDPDTVAMLAIAFNRIGRHQDALDLVQTYPGDHVGYCEQEVHALVDLGTERYSEAYSRVQACLLQYPNSIILLEFRAGLYFSAGHPELAERDMVRLEELGASERVLERLRNLRGIRQQSHPTHP